MREGHLAVEAIQDLAEQNEALQAERDAQAERLAELEAQVALLAELIGER